MIHSKKDIQNLYWNQFNEDYVYFQIDRADTNYVNRIIEGYEYLGVMTTLNTDGLCMIRSTKDTRDITTDILKSLPISVVVIEN